jgi:hypothetical protein
LTTTIGINCTSQYAFVAVVVAGRVAEHQPERLELPALEMSERLKVFVEDTARELKAIGGTAVSVLKAERAPGVPIKHSTVYARATLETLVRLAAVEARVPVELTDRRTVRSRLKIPFKGKLEDHLDAMFPTHVGQYWNAGRGLAAMAALAIQSV